MLNINERSVTSLRDDVIESAEIHRRWTTHLLSNGFDPFRFRLLWPSTYEFGLFVWSAEDMGQGVRLGRLLIRKRDRHHSLPLCRPPDPPTRARLC